MKRGTKPAIVISVAVAITVGALWFTNRLVTPRVATWEDVRKDAQRGNYGLISAEEIVEHIRKDPQNLLLVDTRQEWEYRTGHIRGALNFPMEPTWLSRWRKSEPLQTFLGTDKSRLIIFY
jgi:3-mercaptopyruvate sulfurtransferase SseA